MIGLDIGTKTIKIVELKKRGNAVNLTASGIIGFNGNPVERAVDDREIASLAQIIKKLHKETGISSRDVVISIPEQAAFTRTVNFPLLTDSEISSAIKWELEQYIPIPAQEAISQHIILERNENSNPPKVVVLLVAAPRVLVEKYTKLVTMAGLNPVAVETELMASARATAPPNRTAMLVDIGANSTDIAITKNGVLTFSRSIPIAGEAFSRAVAQGLGIPVNQAEEYKRTYGLQGNQLEGKVKSALDPVLRLVCDEIKKAINFFVTEQKESPPDYVMISGGSSGIPQLINECANLLGIEVSVANPFSKVTLDPTTATKLAPYAPLYTIAIGLALREE